LIWQLELVLFVLAIMSAVVALEVRDLLAAVAVVTAFSFFVALLFAQMGAGDVAFTEAAVGAGVTGVFLLIALYFMDRGTAD
jgi:energy-converting hydrogenase B subunit D